MGKIRTSKQLHPKIIDAQARLQGAQARGASQNVIKMFQSELDTANAMFGRQLEKA